MPVLDLLAISGLLALVSAQDFDLSFTRSENIITLRCEDAATGSLVDNPVFFLNDSLYSLPNRQDIGNGVLFGITRSTEGIYQCASDASVLPAQRSLLVSIVALPSASNAIPANPTVVFEYMEGETARLDCPILPGALRSQYFVTWRSAANTGMVFYQVFPPDRSAPDVRFSDRYTIDNGNFSLYIRDVTPGDVRFEYQCLLGVEDPQNPSALNTYDFASSIDLSLSIISTSPQFIELPQSQIVVSGEDVHFSCVVLSSPSSSIQWSQGGRLIDPTPNRYSIVATSMPNSNQEEGGIIDRSTLTISGVDGFDSDPVRCRATLSLSEATVETEVTLSVLDVVEFNVLPLQDDGFVLQVRLIKRLLDTVAMRINFTEANSNNVVSLTTTTEFCSSVTAFTYVITIHEIPQFDTFTLGVAIVHQQIIGPMRQSPQILFRHQKDGPTLPLSITMSVMILLVIILIPAISVIIVKSKMESARRRAQYTNHEANNKVTVHEIAEERSSVLSDEDGYATIADEESPHVNMDVGRPALLPPTDAPTDEFEQVKLFDISQNRVIFTRRLSSIDLVPLPSRGYVDIPSNIYHTDDELAMTTEYDDCLTPPHLAYNTLYHARERVQYINTYYTPGV